MLTSLAEILIDEGLADQNLISMAAKRSDLTGEPIVVCLVRHHSVDEIAIMAAIQKRLRIDALDPRKFEYDSDALRVLSQGDCRRLRVMPISVVVYDHGPRALRLAMADPTCQVTLAEIEHLSNCAVTPTLVSLSAVEEMIEAGYRQFVTKVMARSDLGRPPGQGHNFGKSSQKHRATKAAAAPALSLQFEALVQLLIDKGVIEQSEYHQALAVLTEDEDKT